VQETFPDRLAFILLEEKKMAVLSKPGEVVR
jgi:hypothetical protein